MVKSREDMSLEELFSRLVRETNTLVRQEVQLATVDLRLSLEAIGRGAAFVLAGAAVVYAGVLTLLAAVVLALGQAGLPWWLAALIVGVVVAGVGYLLFTRAQAELRTASQATQQIADMLKGDEEWLKEQLA